MSMLQQNIYTHYTDNPIRWREILTMRQRKGKWFWRIMYGVSAFIMLIPVLWGASERFNDALNFTIVALTIANITAYILVALRGVLVANDSITRERRDNTWELLMLTGVSRQRLILGKWFGALRVTARDYLWLLLVRMGTAIWVVAQINVNELRWDIGYEMRLSNLSFDSHAWGAILGLLMLFTLLEWTFNTALGIGLGFLRWKGRNSNGAAVGVRVALGLLPPIITYVILDYADGGFFDGFYRNYSEDFINFIFRYTTSFADGGFFSSLFLAERYMVNHDAFSAMMWGTAAGAMTYAALTVGLLWLSNQRAAAIGTNAAEYVGMRKPKRKRKDEAKPAGSAAAPGAQPVQSAIVPGTENIFGLGAPAAYRAEVYSYQRRLGRLYLRLQRGDDVRYARISGVTYLEAPVTWKGGQFDAAGEAAYEAFCAAKGLTINSLRAEHMRLYVHQDGQTDGQMGGAAVRILGTTVEMLEELPHNV